MGTPVGIHLFPPILTLPFECYSVITLAPICFVLKLFGANVKQDCVIRVSYEAGWDGGAGGPRPMEWDQKESPV